MSIKWRNTSHQVLEVDKQTSGGHIWYRLDPDQVLADEDFAERGFITQLLMDRGAIQADFDPATANSSDPTTLFTRTSLIGIAVPLVVLTTLNIPFSANLTFTLSGGKVGSFVGTYASLNGLYSGTLEFDLVADELNGLPTGSYAIDQISGVYQFTGTLIVN